MSTQAEFEKSIKELIESFSNAAKVCSNEVKDKVKQERVLANLQQGYESFLQSVPLYKKDAKGKCPRDTHPCGDYCCPNDPY